MTEPYVTKTGRVLTDEDIERLAAEAEQGYDVSQPPPGRIRLILPVHWSAKHVHAATYSQVSDRLVSLCATGPKYVQKGQLVFGLPASVTCPQCRKRLRVD